jgi:glucosamine-6-phosphate deaminase
MELRILENDNDLSVFAAEIVINHIRKNPNGLIVFPTGNTPLGMFDQLIKNYQRGRVSFKRSCLVELDEYFGIDLSAPCNLFAWLDRTLIQKVDFLPENVFRFNSAAQEPDVEIKRIETVIADKGGIDLLVLGLGPNGHIGFNEPGSSADSQTRVVHLSQESLLSNSRYWKEETVVPLQGITLGMNQILKARKVILLVQGSLKAEILHSTISSPITEKIPATFLRTLEHFVVLADQEAASLLGKYVD